MIVEVVREKHYVASELATLELPDGTSDVDVAKAVERMLEEDAKSGGPCQLDFIDNWDEPDYERSTYYALVDDRQEQVKIDWEDE